MISNTEGSMPLNEELGAVTKYGQQFTNNVNSKKVVEEDVVTVTPVTGVMSASANKFPVSRCSFMEIWFFATTSAKNLAGGDTLSVKFYKRLNGVDYLGETVSVTSPAVTALASAKVDVVPASADLESYDFYTVEGTVTIPSGGTAAVIVGKKTQG